jgi:hypothetical protein
MINIQQEWAFITHEVHYNKPESHPYVGKDLVVRELLCTLQSLLASYNLDKSPLNAEIYRLSKNKYLNLTKPYPLF